MSVVVTCNNRRESTTDEATGGPATHRCSGRWGIIIPVATGLREYVKRGAAAADRVRPRSGIPILIYHRVGRRTSVSVDLDRAVFSDQMAELAERFEVIDLDEAARLLCRGDAPDGRPRIVVTFDDGTADFVDEALPVLVDHRVPATLYVATDFVESGRSFPDDGVALSWDGVREAAASGFVTIGSHTDSHLLLDRVPPAEAASDLDRSIERISDRLGAEVRHFAYPKALLASPEVESEVRRRFVTAAIAGTKPNPFGRTDLHRLSRSPIQVEDAMRWFRHKTEGGMALEDDLRNLYNRVRYRGVAG